MIISLITTLLKFFALMALGFILGKIGIADKGATDKASEFIVKVTMPAMILASACSFKGDIKQMYIAMAVGVCVYMALIFVAKFFAFVFRIPDAERGVCEFMMIFGNVGFMGMPLVMDLFGAEAVMQVSVMHNLAFNLLIYSYGIYLFNGGKGKDKFSPKTLLQPGILVIPIAVLIMVLGIDVPEPVTHVVTMVGDITTPLSMIVIGASFVGVSLKKVFGYRQTYAVAFVRLLAVPLLFTLVLHFVGVDPQLCRVYAATAGLPVAATSAIYSHTYNKNVETASSGILVTTLLSILTVPAVMYVIELFL